MRINIFFAICTLIFVFAHTPAFASKVHVPGSEGNCGTLCNGSDVSCPAGLRNSHGNLQKDCVYTNYNQNSGECECTCTTYHCGKSITFSTTGGYFEGFLFQNYEEYCEEGEECGEEE